MARYNLKEAFSQETALEFGRLYKKEDEWRFQAVGEGYNTGLKTFVDKFINNPRHEEEAREKKLVNIQDNTKSQRTISLDKKLEEKAPHIFNLVKKADISLQKVNLTNHKAKVALCLDISGSMSWLYSSGKIQIFAEKILALGCRFDENASIDIFLFGANAHHVGEMNIDNFKDFIQNVLQKYPLEGGTYYGKAMKMIKEYYFKGWQKMINKHFASNQPVYVMFVTDGATHDQLETEKILKESSHQPIFWQFMAIGKSRKDVKGEGILGWLSQLTASDFSFLEQLDEMNDRFLDNADFFSVEDPETIVDQQLYDLLMAEYPNWVKLAKAKKLLR